MPRTASGLAGAVGTQPLLSLSCADFLDAIERFESWHARWKIQPWQLAPRKDMNVGLDRFLLIERPGTNEQGVARRTVIATPYVGAAFVAKEYLVIPAAAPFEHE